VQCACIHDRQGAEAPQHGSMGMAVEHEAVTALGDQALQLRVERDVVRAVSGLMPIMSFLSRP
jgi:hypothetical protein